MHNAGVLDRIKMRLEGQGTYAAPERHRLGRNAGLIYGHHALSCMLNIYLSDFAWIPCDLEMLQLASEVISALAGALTSISIHV